MITSLINLIELIWHNKVLSEKNKYLIYRDRMFQEKTEKQAREEILHSVKEYYKKYHIKKDFSIGDNIPYSGRVYDYEEMVNLVDSSLDFWLTSGRYAEKFEKSFFNSRHGNKFLK